MKTVKKCELRTIFVHPKTKKLYIEFWDENGKIRQKSTGMEDTVSNRKNVKNNIAPKLIARLTEKALIQKRPKTMNDYAQIYLELKTKLRRYEAIKYRVNRFVGAEYDKNEKDTYGNQRPGVISDLKIKQFLNGLNVCSTTLKEWRSNIRGIFQCAVDDRALADNPMKNENITKDVTASPSRRTDDERKPFSKEEVILLLKHAKGDLFGYLGIGFSSGLRPEELIALQVNSFDFDKKLIVVERAISKGELKETKNESSKRKVPIFDTGIPFVQAQIEIAKQKGTIWLFSDEDGKPLNDIEDLRGKKHKNGDWTALLKEANLHYRQIMNVRHTWAILALKSKQFTPQEIANILGHTTLRMLWQNYARFLGNDHEHIRREIDIFT
jgi:integrase